MCNTDIIARVTYERQKKRKRKKSPFVPLLSSQIPEEWRQTANLMGLNLKRKKMEKQRTIYGNGSLLVLQVTCTPHIGGFNVSHLRDVAVHLRNM